MTFSEITALIKSELGNETIRESREDQLMPVAYIEPAYLDKVGHLLHTHDKLYFDQLAAITGIDHGPEKALIEVAYNFNSIPYNHQYCIKISMQRNNDEKDPVPTAKTLSHIWKTALWQEREVFDLFGIYFEGHPDMRRILLPADWEGYPLRKDYKERAYYHGVKIEY